MIRYAMRTLRKSPGYTAACIAVLALGIGANTAIFSLVYSVILRPLPYPDVDRLVFLWTLVPELGEPFADHFFPTRTIYDQWRQESTSFTEMAAYADGPLPETGVERPRAIRTDYVAANLLPMLGAQARLGRLFQPAEEQPGQDRVVVLSDQYFEKRFHSDPQTLGKTVALNGVDYTVIGVLPPRFQMPSNFQGGNRNAPEVFLPLSRRLATDENPLGVVLTAIGKLKPGVTAEQARVELSGIRERARAASKDEGEPRGANVISLSTEDKSEDLNGGLYILLGAVGFVLLIACANLANLTLARATLRTREIAVRRALGASRPRIILQLMSESFLVSLWGAGAGLLLAVWIVQGFRALVPGDLQRPEMGELNLAVFAFAVAASVLTTLLFGLMPAISASRISVNAALKAGGPTASGASARSRQLLTVFEVAIALVLLVGAGLLIRSFSAIVNAGIGFNAERLALVSVELPDTRYKDAPSRARFLGELLTRARNMPGVVSAAITDTLPLHAVFVRNFDVAGRPKQAAGKALVTDAASVSTGYLEAIGVPVLAGRALTEADVARNSGKGDGVILINQSFADTYLSGEDPLKVRLTFEGDGRAHQIVGVIENFRAMGADKDIRPQYFSAGVGTARSMLVLRTAVPPESLADDARAVLWSLDKELVTADVSTMESFIDRSLESRWFGMVLLVTFAALALLLAMIGVYSVLSNLVASRTREIGIRMALGAAPATIGRMIATQSLRPIAIGLVVGVVASLALGRVLESMLFQVTPRDPLTLLLAVVAILVAAPFAILIPMRRATRVECTEALREE